MKVIQDKDNFLINRKEVKIIVEQESTPDYKKAREILKKEFGGDENTIVIKKVKGKFGRKTFLISAFIYKSKEDKEKFEKEKEESKEDKKEESKEDKKEESKEDKKEESKEGD